MKNKKVERTLNALESIFELKKDIGTAVKNAKDQASTYGLQGIILVKEFSDSIEELFKNDAENKPSDEA